jgi:glycosyltransferase involved in cell wall biosynthesis
VGPPPPSDRVFFTELWFRGHNNQRYSELLPRMERIDPFLIPVTGVKYARGVEFRVLSRIKQQRYSAVFAGARRRYGSMFAVDPDQVAFFPGPTLVDLDDPRFTPSEVAALRSPSVRACVFTSTRVASRFGALGVEKPMHIVPQGVSRASLNQFDVARVRDSWRRPGEIVVGHMGSWLLSAGDRGGGDPATNIDHLLEVWDALRARVPSARLWLLGGPGERLRRRVAGRDDILLIGWKPRNELLAWVANFDFALFARSADQGWQLAKFAEYMGCGVPTVAYDYDVTADLRAAGAGLFASSPAELVDAAESVAMDPELRARLAAAALDEGRRRDWDLLAGQYAELFDRYLPGA